MRLLYKIVLGLLLFNAFITLFSPLFAATQVDTGLSGHAVNYSSSDMTDYSLTDQGITGILGLIFTAENAGALIGMTVIGVIAVAGAIAFKHYLLIGVGLFVSVVVGLYIKMSSVIAGIGSQVNNVYVDGIIAIVGIAIGVLVVFAVIDMFAPASARE